MKPGNNGAEAEDADKRRSFVRAVLMLTQCCMQTIVQETNVCHDGMYVMIVAMD